MHRLVLAAVLLAGACDMNDTPPSKTRIPIEQESGPANAGGVSAQLAAEAKALFGQRCAVCHGSDGTGKGPSAETLDVKPRDYTDAAWQKSVTDQQIADTIVKGGMAVGKSGLMPGNPDLKGKPELVRALVAHIRAFGKQ